MRQTINRLLSLALCVILLLIIAQTTRAQTTQFTYQGKLTDGGLPANGPYDFKLKLCVDAACVTTIVEGTIGDVQVTAGIFTLTPDFTAVPFTTSPTANFLEISVRPGASTGPYTTLTPNQPITSSPYSVRTLKANSADSVSGACTLCITDGHIASVDGAKVTGTVANAWLPAANISGVLSASQGGTGIGPGNPPPDAYLRSNGAGWTLSSLLASDIAGVVQIANGGTGSLTKNFADLTTDQNIGGNKTFTGTISGNGSGLNTLNGANITRGSVNGPQLGNLSVSSSALGNGAVLTNKISDGAVTTGKLADGSVTAAKIAPGAVAGTLKWNVITENQQAESNNGYLVRNVVESEVTITLPTAPNPGDVVRVSGGGTNGWRIAQNAGQTISRFSTGIPVSWTLRESVRGWRSVASSADGSKLVAVDGGGSGGQIYCSTDSGVNWTPRDSIRRWRSVASSADGSKLVAVVGGSGLGQIYTSTDSGATWKPNENNRFWESVASSADGSKLVAAVGGSNSGQIYTSTDFGGNWTPRDSSRPWSSVASSANGSKLVAADGLGKIYTSTDSGANWTPHESSRLWSSVASSADGSRLVAVVNGGQTYTSTDSGANWTPRESVRDWFSVASSEDGTKLVAVVSNGQIYTSADSGVNWTSRESSRVWYAVASSADGTKLVAVVFGGQIYTAVSAPIVTTVGVSGYLSGGTLSAIELQYVGGGKFIWLSHEGDISTN